MKLRDKVYLGDSVYAQYDGYHILLTTENGLGASNEIFIEPNVLKALLNYNEIITEKYKVEGVYEP